MNLSAEIYLCSTSLSHWVVLNHPLWDVPTHTKPINFHICCKGIRMNPYNRTENSGVRKLFAVAFHLIAIGMTIGLLILLIAAVTLSGS